MPTLLVCSATDELQTLQAQLQSAAATTLPELKVVLWPDAFDADDVVGVAAWHPPSGVLGALPHLKVVASIGAGTEHVLRCPDLPAQVSVTRIVDADQAQGMAEYVLWAALHYHRDLDQMLAQQRRHTWRMPAQRSASQFRVGIMGLGVMGRQSAVRLRDNGFAVSGWSRSPRTLEGIATFAGDASLADFLAPLDLVVCLLPLTPSTTGLCNAAFFAQLKPGAVLVNAGRGEHVVLADLVAALDANQVRAALLDVFAHEPLASDDPLWSHPKITITPHMASAASEAAIAQQIVGNLRRVLDGQAPEHAIDRAQSY